MPKKSSKQSPAPHQFSWERAKNQFYHREGFMQQSTSWRGSCRRFLREAFRRCLEGKDKKMVAKMPSNSAAPIQLTQRDSPPLTKKKGQGASGKATPKTQKSPDKYREFGAVWAGSSDIFHFPSFSKGGGWGSQRGGGNSSKIRGKRGTKGGGERRGRCRKRVRAFFGGRGP